MSKRKKKTTSVPLELEDENESIFIRVDGEFYADEVDVVRAIEEELPSFWTSLLTIARNGFQEQGEGYVYVKTNSNSCQIAWRSSVLYRADAYFVPQVNKFESYDPETEFRLHIEFEDGIFEGTASMEPAPEQSQKAA